MRMQLRVRRVSARDAPRGRVAVGGRDQILGGLLDHLGAIAAANDRHPLTQIADRALDRPRVRRLDLLPLPRIPERPDDRHRLRGAERHIDPATPRTIRARPAQPPAGPGMPALHQRDEIPALHRGIRIDAQTGQRVRGREPAARRLRQLAAGREVVVPALGGDRLALQIAGVTPAPAGTDARSAHHPLCTDPNPPKPATKRHSDHTATALLCILCGLAVEEQSDAELYGAGRASLLVAWCLGRGVRLCRPLRPRGSQGEHVEQVERGTYDGYRSGRRSGSPSSGRGLLRLMVAAGVVAGVRSCDRRPAQRHQLSASPATVGALLGQCRWSMQ